MKYIKLYEGWKDPIKNTDQLNEMIKLHSVKLKLFLRALKRLRIPDELFKKVEKLIDNRIIERSYGSLAGLSHEETIAKYGQEQFDKWHRGWNDRPPEGECFADVEIRVQSFIDDLKTKYAGQDIGIAISAHGNSIRLFRKIMEGATVEETCGWAIPYDQYFEYEI